MTSGVKDSKSKAYSWHQKVYTHTPHLTSVLDLLARLSHPPLTRGESEYRNCGQSVVTAASFCVAHIKTWAFTNWGEGQFLAHCNSDSGLSSWTRHCPTPRLLKINDCTVQNEVSRPSFPLVKGGQESLTSETTSVRVAMIFLYTILLHLYYLNKYCRNAIY